jgi:hypothetical protein
MEIGLNGIPQAGLLVVQTSAAPTSADLINALDLPPVRPTQSQQDNNFGTGMHRSELFLW